MDQKSFPNHRLVFQTFAEKLDLIHREQAETRPKKDETPMQMKPYQRNYVLKAHAFHVKQKQRTRNVLYKKQHENRRLYVKFYA